MLENDNAKLKAPNEDEESSKEEKFKDYLRNRHIYTKDGIRYSYLLSVFGMTEVAMLRDTFDDLDEESMVLKELSSDDIDSTFIDN